MKKILLLSFVLVSFVSNAQTDEAPLPPCMLGFDYLDPTLYVSDADISKAVSKHPPADSQHKFLLRFDLAKQNSAPETLLYELAANATAYYKVRDDRNINWRIKETYGLQAEGVLEELEHYNYLRPIK